MELIYLIAFICLGICILSALPKAIGKLVEYIWKKWKHLDFTDEDFLNGRFIDKDFPNFKDFRE